MSFIASALFAASLFAVEDKLQQDDSAAQLLNAVELPTPEARARAATRLAKKRGVSLEQWTAQMEAFGVFDPVDSGRHSYRAKLWVNGQKVSRQLEYYVPPDYDPARPSPLLLLLHGAGGTGKQMFQPWQRLAEQQGYLLLAPTDPDSFKGYAFTQTERDMALQALRWMRLRFNVNENRIHVHGVSRGGHLTWDLGLRYRDRFAALIPAIGGPTWVINEGRNNMRYMENLWDMPIRDLQGSKDDFKLLSNLKRSFERLEDIGNTNAHLVEFEDLGHSFRADTIDWTDFIDNSERTPYPQRLLIRASKPSTLRNAWIRVERVERDIQETFPLKVKPKQWQSLDDGGKARFVQDLVDAKTAQVDAKRLEDGSFELQLDGVKQASLMLPLAWIPEGGKVQVAVGKRTKTLRAVPSKTVLLFDFVERFDRTVLPVCEVIVRH